MVAEPAPAAVTTPEASTVAISGALLVHVTPTPGSSNPFWSRTPARSRTVSPGVASPALSGVTTTESGRAGGAIGWTAPSLHDQAQRMPVASSSPTPADLIERFAFPA